uniref:Uncharacterized protein n=1 Tax=Caenorhabditis japonica TaxID=281687 RepID=A0A8R1E3V0_CAEJA
ELHKAEKRELELKVEKLEEELDRARRRLEVAEKAAKSEKKRALEMKSALDESRRARKEMVEEFSKCKYQSADELSMALAIRGKGISPENQMLAVKSSEAIRKRSEGHKEEALRRFSRRCKSMAEAVMIGEVDDDWIAVAGKLREEIEWLLRPKKTVIQNQHIILAAPRTVGRDELVFEYKTMDEGHNAQVRDCAKRLQQVGKKISVVPCGYDCVYGDIAKIQEMWSEWKDIGVVLPLKPTGNKMTPLISLAPPEGANRIQLAKFLEMAIGETVLVKKLC